MFNFALPEEAEVGGRLYSIRADFRVILEIFVMLGDPDLSDADKTEAMIRMFYVERPEDRAAAVAAFRDFVEPGQGRRKRGGAPLIDWEKDFDLMVAPVNRVLGTECRALPFLHWKSFLAAYMEIPPESVFSQVLHIRTKLRSGEKLEKHERKWYRENRDLVDRKLRLSKDEEDILNEWT